MAVAPPSVAASQFHHMIRGNRPGWRRNQHAVAGFTRSGVVQTSSRPPDACWKKGESIVSDPAHLHLERSRHESAPEIGLPHPGLCLRCGPLKAVAWATVSTSRFVRTKPTSNCTLYTVPQENTKVTPFETASARAGCAHVPRSDLGLNIQTLDARATTTTGCVATTTQTMLRRCCRRAPSCTSSVTWTTFAGEQERS